MPSVKIRNSRSMFFLLIANCISLLLHAQHDSLVFKNSDVIVGELKSLDKGAIIIETDYSENDFTIEWSGIKEIYTKSSFLITLEDGTRINGTVQSYDSSTRVHIIEADGQITETTLPHIVYLKGVKSDFWSRAYANIDLGLSATKANNLWQYSMRSTVGYVADRWLLDIYYDDIRSRQDSVSPTKRTESGIAFTYFLQSDWFARASVSTLSNTEQALKLRLTFKAGAGNYLIHTNKSYLGVGAGLSSNNETFTNETEKRSSLEAYGGAELNIFDIGDFSLFSSLNVYPSLTESGRWRTDFKLDTKYDLPLDFYIGLGLTLNYDNRPAITGNETDYVMAFSVGWEL